MIKSTELPLFQKEGAIVTMFQKLKAMPLKNLDSAGLTIAMQESALSEPGHFDFNLIYKAIASATYLHAKQTRANRGNLPRTPYIEHPLRNALRAFRWGCMSQDIIIAILLHDTVEDSAERICRDHYGMDIKQMTKEEMREVAYRYITEEFNAEVCRLVAGVTNGFLTGDETPDEKRNIYADHVKDSISDPDIFLVKIADFVDNASGLYHNNIKPNEAKVINLARKYLPVVDIFEEQLNKFPTELKISAAGYADLRKHLRDTRKRLLQIIEQHG
jgi:(p)ppGpp synthase/HD superfamily hydrolase